MTMHKVLPPYREITETDCMCQEKKAEVEEAWSIA